MTTTYRVTCRPVSPYNVPDGWTALRPLVPDERWNYGEVDYPEPLEHSVAEHFSLLPVRDGKAGLELWPQLRMDGELYQWVQLLGERPDSEDVLYRYATEQASMVDIENYVAERARLHDVKIEVVWPDES